MAIRTLSVLVALIIAVIGGVYLYVHSNAAPVQNTAQAKTYSSSTYGLSFTYPSDYEVEEHPSTEANMVGTIVLIRSEDRAHIPANSDGPPTISISVFKNAKKQFPLQWAQQNVAYSNYQQKVGSETELVVGGANALGYSADGLYLFQVIVVATGDNMYVLSGSYSDEDSLLYQDFNTIVDSVQFIPTNLTL
jgi:hypothetical protein